MNKRLSQVLSVVVLLCFFFNSCAVLAVEFEGEDAVTIPVNGRIGNMKQNVKEPKIETQRQLVVDTTGLNRKQLPKMGNLANSLSWYGWLFILFWVLLIRVSIKKRAKSI